MPGRCKGAEVMQMSELPGSSAPSIVIVGSGPAGCYLAHFLRKRWHDAEIVVFDRLSLPYGLVRYGVAPDHTATKAVTRQFDRLFERDGVRFVGQTEVGRDVTIDQLREAFDIIVLATGLPADRELGVPGSEGSGAGLAGLYGSGRVTRLINGHPEESVEGVTFGSTVSIVGQGNVAIDLLRLLLTSAAELRSHGVPVDVVERITAGPVRHIDVVGRSGPNEAKFDIAMIRELTKIPNVQFLADDAELNAPVGAGVDTAKRDAVAKLIESTSGLEPVDAAPPRSVRFHFGWTPERLTGEGTVHGVVFRRTDASDGCLALRADSVLTAIGFSERIDAALRRQDHETPESHLDSGRLAPGLYCVGWLRRGPQGTIPANRTDAKSVADAVGAAFDAGEFSPGKPGFAGLALLQPTP